MKQLINNASSSLLLFRFHNKLRLWKKKKTINDKFEIFAD